MSARRNASRADKAKSAVSELLALKREGGSRAQQFNFKEEKTVYDVVSDADYAELVAKRRSEHGGFVVGDEGMGYADIGEEDDWDRAAEDAEEDGDDAPAEDDASNKRKGGADPKGKAPKAKKKKPELPANYRSVAGMFTGAKASAGVSKGAAQVDTNDDDLLEGIMGDLDADVAAENASGPAQTVHVARRPMSSMAPPRPPPAYAAPRAPLPAARRPAPDARPVLLGKRPLMVEEAAPEDVDMGDDDDDAAPPAGNDSDGEEEPATPAPARAGATTATPAAPAKSAVELSAADATPAAGSTAVEAVVAAKATPAKAAVAQAPALEEAALSAATGWQEVFSTQDEGAAEASAEAEAAAAAAATAALGGEQLDARLLDASTGTLPFYFLDAHEEPGYNGASPSVNLFGKVAVEGQFVSCALRVGGLQHGLFVVPSPHVFGGEAEAEISALEEAATAGGAARGALMKHLHERAAGLKAEIRAALTSRGVKSMTIAPVKRSYCFERGDIPRGEQWVLKVRVPAGSASLPSDLKGEHFLAVLGTQTSALEALLLKRKVMGPEWLAISNPTKVARESQSSWCKLEVAVASPKDIGHPAAGAIADAPQLTVAAISLKTYVSPQHGRNEIAAASVVHLKAVKVDGPTLAADWNTAQKLRAFTAVRRLEGRPFPPGFEAEARKKNESSVGRLNGGQSISAQGSERALLSFLLAKLSNIDADIIVGHNVGAFDIDVLLHRLQACKVPHWSRLGRLKRNRMPNLGGGGNQFGGGASPGVMSVMAGRLVCDTYLAAREFIQKEVNYTLAQLARSQLGQARIEVGAADVPPLYDSAQKLLGLISAAENDAWLSLGLMFHMSVLPLTRQLTNLSGSLWTKTLQGARAQRIEYLLLHEFHARKFLLPDKLSFKEKERISKAARAEEGGDDDDDAGDAPGGRGSGGKKRGAPAYAGGLVLEPKKGLYDKYVVMLDFNSLYPSIIQEYNICFTTVQRPEGHEGMAPLPDAAPSVEELAVLPTVIRKLVQRRRQVKDMLKSERDVTKKQQLDIRQQALKLTANSMYGCLGFANSRFFAQPLAELVTSQGRDILQSTVDLVQQQMELEVVYGDTDSIMIYTATEDLAEVKKIGAAVKKEVNKRYRLLEIEMDGMFKRMLLLKKKKYAALLVTQAADGSLVEAMEQKGLDIVRRDWCPLSKDVGNFALQEVLSGKPREDVVEAIHARLRAVREQMDAGGIPIGKYIITKQLTKRPEDYPDARNQPHVQVALRRRAANKRDGVAAGETVPYVICIGSAAGEKEKEEGGAAEAAKGSTAHGKGLAERAYHPEELRASQAGGGSLQVDVEYYLSQQVHPVVSRLIAPVEGTDAAHLADCLGLDASKFHAQVAAQASGADDALLAGASMLDDESRYNACEPLKLRAADGTEFPFAGASELVNGKAAAAGALAPPPQEGQARAPKALTAAQLANQCALAARRTIQQYYDGEMRCDDEIYPYETRDVCTRQAADASPGTLCAATNATGRMGKKHTEAQLYTQLTHFLRQVDLQAALARIKDEDVRQERASALAPLAKALGAAAEEVRRVSGRSGFKWVDMSRLTAACF